MRLGRDDDGWPRPPTLTPDPAPRDDVVIRDIPPSQYIDEWPQGGLHHAWMALAGASLAISTVALVVAIVAIAMVQL